MIKKYEETDINWTNTKYSLLNSMVIYSTGPIRFQAKYASDLISPFHFIIPKSKLILW